MALAPEATERTTENIPLARLILGLGATCAQVHILLEGEMEQDGLTNLETLVER